MKWLVGLSAILGLPFLGLAGVAIALIASAHGDVGRFSRDASSLLVLQCGPR
ncbi:hypothetical protein [Curtobacterium sp. PhB137]|uniref:hypothetical protein n=1 Tax=Curtobacterium sp. PhB137 TaxID=2485182 RepID=UPI0016087968|nr:hypothetical protein [Curtobacterium sp. PhB137]